MAQELEEETILDLMGDVKLGFEAMARLAQRVERLEAVDVHALVERVAALEHRLETIAPDHGAR